MYRSQQSATSAKSASSFYGFSSASQIQNPPSLTSNNGSNPLDTDTLSPDELFTRHSVSEVKVIQQRLRHDAEVKQEELRLMVGERYRDLIQASSSIISMGTSSQRVLSAFEESKDAILDQQEPPLPSRSTTFGGVNDRHLHALQTLSAHLKVLLDAPEHLWRFIEKKRYLSAAWLFLFIRVVHRGLVQNDDEEEDSWTRIGMDVSSEFPLVQRQWEEVSSFRSQIIHKATLSLRELGSSAKDICATLTALHLLDSRPLNETFAALFTQRSKALAPLISWRIEQKHPPVANGRSPGSQAPSETVESRLRSAKEILRANQEVLNTIISTISTSREVFEVRGSRKHSLITLLLRAMQSEPLPNESSTNDDKSLSDLSLSTPSLLVNSTSSAHFLLLPSNLQSYRPYVDLSSASVNYSQIEFQRALADWLNKSSKSWQDASDSWFTNLATVTEVWEVRGSLRKTIESSGLEFSEKGQICTILDNLCRSRTIAIWTAALSGALGSFKKGVFVFLSNTRKQEEVTLFKTPPPPSLSSQATKTLDLMPFRRYQHSLKQHLLGRTAQLDAVLTTLEQCARSIQDDLSIVLSDTSEEGKSFGQVLVDAYQPEAESTADSVALTLEEAVDSALSDSEIDNLVGLANILDDLGSLSIFITHVGCRRNAVQKFRARIDFALDRVIQEWRDRTIDQILEPLAEIPPHTISSQTVGPSPRLFQSLLSLSAALRELGVRHEYLRHQPVVQESLRLFICRMIKDGPQPPHTQDLLFLKAIAGTYGPDWDEVNQAISDSLETSGNSSAQEGSDAIAMEHLARTQTLLSTLLPCSPRLQSPPTSTGSGASTQAQFLLFNTPSSKQEYQAALEVAKPSPRFGLLLVSSSENP